METPETKKKKRTIAGWATAIGLHAVIVVLLLIFGFTTPLPRPEPEGISVDLGIPDVGGPDDGATISDAASAAASQSELSPDATEDSDNAALPENQNKNSQTNNTETKNSPVTTPERNIDSELERRLAALRNSGGGGSGDGEILGEGGDPNGTDGADKGLHGIWGDAEGLGAGRYLKKTPVINEQKQQTGFIEVEVLVNRQGKVVNARVLLGSSSQTTITDTRLHDKVVRAVKEQAQYSPTSIGSDVQRTKYIFEFKLN